MTAQDLEHPAVRRGRAARQTERLARSMESLPYLTRKLAPVEVISAEGLEQIEENADTLLEQVGIEIGNFPEAIEIFRGAGADVDGTRVRFARGMCRSIIRATAPRIFTQRARNPRPERRHRRPVHGPRPVLRLAVHPQPRRRPALRDDRGLPQLREAHLHEPHAPSRRRDVVRAGRPAGQQAPPRDGLQPHPLLRTGRSWARSPIPSRAQDSVDMVKHPVRRGRRGARARDHGPGQRELADVVGLQHARLGQGLRREQPDHAHHAVHPRRCDGPGDGRRAGDPDARRGARRDGVLPDRPARGAGHLRVVRVVDVDAVGRPDVRHARSRSSCCSCSPRSPGGSASRSAAAATSPPPRCPTTRPPTRARSASWRRCRPGVNFNLHTAGWLEGGLAIGYEKFILDEDQASMAGAFLGGVDLTDNGLALAGDARRRSGPALPRLTAHPGQLRERVLAVRAVEQRQLRAVGARTASRDAAAPGQRPLEAAPRRVRGAAARRRRSTRRSSSGWIDARRASPTPTSRSEPASPP